MTRRKLENKNIRKLTKTGGNSISLILPIDMIRKLGWRSKQKVVVKQVGSKLVITDWKK